MRNILKLLGCCTKTQESESLVERSVNNNYKSISTPLNIEPGHEQPADNSLIRFIQGSFNFTNTWIRQNQILILRTGIDATSDAGWALMCYLMLNYKFKKTEDESLWVESQWTGQQVVATVAMAPFVIFASLYFYRKSQPIAKRDIILNAAAGAGSIFAWHVGQIGGIAGLKSLGVSRKTAEYIASFTIGPILDGSIQYVIVETGDFVLDRKVRQHYINNPKSFFKELALNASLGALPCLVWQITYFLCAENNDVGPWLTAFLVALNVAIMNIISFKIIEAIMHNEKANMNSPASLITSINSPVTSHKNDDDDENTDENSLIENNDFN